MEQSNLDIFMLWNVMIWILVKNIRNYNAWTSTRWKGVMCNSMQCILMCTAQQYLTMVYCTVLPKWNPPTTSNSQHISLINSSMQDPQRWLTPINQSVHCAFIQPSLKVSPKILFPAISGTDLLPPFYSPSPSPSPTAQVPNQTRRSRHKYCQLSLPE